MKSTLIVGLFVWAGIVSTPGNDGRTRPDFSGAWKADQVLSKALTESRGHQWPEPVVASGGNPTAAGPTLSPTTFITHTDAALTVEDRLDTYVRRRVYKLDGSESVNVSSTMTERSRSTWKGDRLVTAGTQFLEFDSGDIERTFETTRYIAPTGHMHVETITKDKGRPDRSRFTVLVRHKP